MDANAIRLQLNLKKGELDLVAGGPPCQGFSINAPNRSSKDERNHLFKEFIRFVDEFEPRAVLIENVPGLVSFENGMTLQAILDELKNHGYHADVRILYAPHYGVPQTRWRTIIIGFKDEESIKYAFPQPEYDAPLRVNFTSHFDGKNIISFPKTKVLPQHISVKEALDDLPVLKNGETGDVCKQYKTKPANQFQEIMRQGAVGVYNHEAARFVGNNRVVYTTG